MRGREEHSALLVLGLTLVILEAGTLPVAAQPVMVDVGGHRLEAFVLGAGRPTVIFEAGFIGGMERFRWLQDRVAEHTTTLSYERAGLGESEAGPEPRTASAIAAELHELTQALALDAPIIFVGHSAGGFFGRVFVARHAELVGAAVLVDPVTTAVYRAMHLSDPQRWEQYPEVIEDAYSPGPGWIGQWRALPQSMEEVDAAFPLPTVPVHIFTAMIPIEGEWALEDEARIDVWLASHRELAAVIPGAAHHVIPDRHHGSILQDPSVLDVILELVRAIRAGAEAS